MKYKDWQIEAICDKLLQRANEQAHAFNEERRSRGLPPDPKALEYTTSWIAQDVIRVCLEAVRKVEGELAEAKKVEINEHLQSMVAVVDPEKSKVPKRRKKSDPTAE